jgi:hypothetical protein
MLPPPSLQPNRTSPTIPVAITFCWNAEVGRPSLPTTCARMAQILPIAAQPSSSGSVSARNVWVVVEVPTSAPGTTI